MLSILYTKFQIKTMKKPAFHETCSQLPIIAKYPCGTISKLRQYSLRRLKSSPQRLIILGQEMFVPRR